MSSYLDSLARIAFNGPPPGDEEKLRRLANIAGSASYQPQKGLQTSGNIDLASQPQVRNNDGSTSTVRSMSFNEDGKEILIPTVAHDGSRILNDNEAIDQYRKSGKHLGIFDSPENATTYAQQLHNDYESGRIKLSNIASKDQSKEQPVDLSVSPYFGKRESIEPVQETNVDRRLADIREQQSNLQRTPAHGLRRALGNVAGTGIGILSANPIAGINVAENIKNAPYFQQYGDLERQAEALQPVQTAQQKRTTEATERYKAAATASLGQEKLGEKTESDRTIAEIRRGHESELVAKDNQLAADKLAHRQQIDELNKRHEDLAKELQRVKDEAALYRQQMEDPERMKRAQIAASGGINRIEQGKLPSAEEVQAAENAHGEIVKAPDSATKERIITGLTPKAREHLQSKYPSDLSYKKLGAPEQLRADSSKNTLKIIKEVRDLVKKRPDIIGPAVGRAAGLKGVVGIQDQDTSRLEGLLTTLFVNEASIYGTGRATKTLLDTIKEGGVARLPQNPSQFEGRLRATEDAAKINYKSVTNEDYKDEDDIPDKVEVIKVTPVKK